MLQVILTEARAILSERKASSTIYCGWGTYLDSLVYDYIDQGGSWRVVRKVLSLA